MSKSKHKSISTPDNISDQRQDSLLGLFARIFWSLIGNMILLFLASKIYRAQTLLSIFDLLFWTVALLIIAVRYVDIKYLKGVTYEGLPATLEDWRSYVKYFSFFSAGLWLLPHVVSFLKK
jgi:uncharacterized membrane protein